MTAEEAFFAFYQGGIPLADLRLLFQGYFHIPLEKVPLLKEELIAREDFDKLLRKLKEGYPVCYLTGYDEIRGLRIFLSPDVLIPRTETIDFIYGYFREKENAAEKKVLDLCTGSGFIALALKSLFPTSQVQGSDISLKALALARKSASYNHLPIDFVQSDYLTSIDGKFDFIISNPPYIEEDAKDVDAPFEPALALYSGKDGMDSYRKIFRQLEAHLLPEGKAYFELEASNAESVFLLSQRMLPSYHGEFILDMEGKKRYLKLSRSYF